VYQIRLPAFVQQANGPSDIQATATGLYILLFPLGNDVTQLSAQSSIVSHAKETDTQQLQLHTTECFYHQRKSNEKTTT